MDGDGRIVKRSANLKDLEIEEYSTLFRTKDIYLAAFLMSRGLDIFGYEQVEFIKNKFKVAKKDLKIFFLFREKDQSERLALHFYNQNRANLNVNANSYVSSILTVRSVITDPPVS